MARILPVTEFLSASLTCSGKYLHPVSRGQAKVNRCSGENRNLFMNMIQQEGIADACARDAGTHFSGCIALSL